MDIIHLTEHESVLLETQYGTQIRITHTAVGELEMERVDGATITAVPLSRSIILLIPLPVSARQYRDKESREDVPC
mgnify:CR=1 FL=1